MRVLFIYTNINGFHLDTYSFGLASIVAVTLQEGHQAKVVLVHNKEEYSLVEQAIEEFSPHLVGFSSVSSQFAFVKELAAVVKRRAPKVPIVCGGVHPTLNPDVVVEAEALDVVFVGESELAFVDFLRAMGNWELGIGNWELGILQGR